MGAAFRNASSSVAPAMHHQEALNNILAQTQIVDSAFLRDWQPGIAFGQGAQTSPGPCVRLAPWRRLGRETATTGRSLLQDKAVAGPKASAARQRKCAMVSVKIRLVLGLIRLGALILPASRIVGRGMHAIAQRSLAC